MTVAVLVRLEAWTAKYSIWLALGTIIAAFGLRLAYADSCYLNPDEALHFDVARPQGWLEAYQASRTVTHPPLFVLVLHGILFFGRSELALRLPSVVGGTAALWLIFAWLRRSLGNIAALAGLGLMAFSPAAISASTEVRQYGLLLFFVCGSLYATERALTEHSTTWAVILGLFLLAALLTHYIAVLVIACLALYVLCRSLLDKVPRRILFTIGTSYLVLASVLCWLYFGHIRKSILSNAGADITYLQPYFYAPEHETRLRFVWRALYGTFYRVVGSQHLTFLLILVFLAGLATLLAGRTKAPRLMGLLVLSPFAVGLAAAAAHLFPFAGSRHQTYLLPFVAASVAAAIAPLKRGWDVSVLFLAAVVAPVWALRTVPDNDRRVQAMSDMKAAIDYMHRTVTDGSILFVDGETFNLLTYYLGRNDPRLDAWPGAQWYSGPSMGGYRVIVVAPGDNYLVHFRPPDALANVNEEARALGFSRGDHLWVISAGWLEKPLASQITLTGDCESREFGRISVIKTVLPSVEKTSR